MSTFNDRLFVPLSESPLAISGGHGIVVDQQTWHSDITLLPGEQRHFTFDVRVPAKYVGEALGVLRVPAGARLTLAIHMRVGAGVEWTSIIAVEGGGEVVIERQTAAIGKGSTVRLVTVANLQEQARLQVADDVRCEAPESRVSVCMHTVLRDAAKADTRARIVVAAEAGNSDVSESLCHLLLGSEARARALPELDVRQKDIRCQHRSFIGQPKEAERFFLQSRGLSEFRTNEILTRGFLQAALEDVPAALVDKTLDELLLV